MTNTERLLLCAANASPDGYLELPAPRVTMDAMLQRGWFEVCNTRYRITVRGRDQIER